MYTRQLTNMTRTHFCKKYNLSPSSLAKWELGITDFAPKSANILAENFHKEGIQVSAGWLLTGEGEAAKKILQRKINLGEISSEKELIEKELLEFESFHEKTLSIRIYDDSCFPLYIPGDYIAGVAFEGEQVLTLRERICIVQLESGAICIRKITDYNDENFTYDLECINPYSEIAHKISKAVHLRAAAPITFFRRPSP